MAEEKKVETSFHFLSEELHQMMSVVGTKGWIALTCCCVLLVLFLIWSFAGTIPIKVGGWGIVLSPQGTQVIVAEVAGTVAMIEVEEGQTVKAGQVLVKLTDPRTYLDIQLQEQRVTDSRKDLENLIKSVEQENKARRHSILTKMESIKLAKKNTESRIPFLEDDLAKKKRLSEKGILARPDVERANSDLLTAHNQIQAYDAELASLQSDLTVGYRQTEIDAKRNELSSHQEQLNHLLLLQSYTEIKAPQSGKVIEITVSKGQRLEPGHLVASIESLYASPQDMEFYALIGAEYGVLIKKGLAVQIEVAGITPKTYGYLLGKIIDVSPYPVSDVEITSQVPNAELAKHLKDQNKAVYSVSISLDKDPTTVNGFRWTTKKGPPFYITPGTLGVARIIIEERRPAYYILPQEISPYVQEAIPLTRQPS